MKVTVNSQTLAKELRLLSKIVAVKPVIPILSHVLFKAEGTLRLLATDLEIGISVPCEAQVITQGAIALPASKLLAMVEQFPNQDVTIALDKAQVLVKSGVFKSRLQALPVEDFPQLPESEGNASSLDAKEFRRLIECTRYAILGSNTRYMLQGALLVLTELTAAMVATDGKRLALATMPHVGINTRVILPIKTLDVFLMQTDFSDLEVAVGTQHLFFISGERLLISRMLEGEFPNYERIIPRENNKSAIFDRVMFAAALRRVGLVAEDNQATYLTLSQGSLLINAQSAQIGEAEEQLAIDYDGPALKVCVNWRYVLDFLEAASKQTVTLSMNTAEKPLLLTDGDNFINVILPMRV